MKSIWIISVRPEWVAKILNGEKTIEVRKHALNEGDEVHIYCTKAKPWLLREHLYCSTCGTAEGNKQWEEINYNLYENINLKYAPFFADTKPILNGKVVAKFIVGKVEKIDVIKANQCLDKDYSNRFEHLVSKAGLNDGEFLVYAKGIAYFIEITQLEIFDKPRELGEYYTFKKKTVYSGMDCPPYVDEVKCPITRAPQSYFHAWIEE